MSRKRWGHLWVSPLWDDSGTQQWLRGGPPKELGMFGHKKELYWTEVDLPSRVLSLQTHNDPDLVSQRIFDVYRKKSDVRSRRCTDPHRRSTDFNNEIHENPLKQSDVSQCFVSDVKAVCLLFLHVVTILTCGIFTYGVYALTTMPMVFLCCLFFFFFFCSEFHWQQQKDGGRITFASHMSLKSVLGVLLLPRRIRQKTSCFFFSSPPFFSGRSLVNKQQTSTKKSQSDPAVN